MTIGFTDREKRFIKKFLLPKWLSYTASAAELQEFGRDGNLTINAVRMMHRKIKKKFEQMMLEEDVPLTPRKQRASPQKSPRKSQHKLTDKEMEDFLATSDEDDKKMVLNVPIKTE